MKRHDSVFTSLLDMGGFVPPYGRQSVNGGGGGLMKRDIDLIERGPNFKRLCHKLKVLLLLMILL